MFVQIPSLIDVFSSRCMQNTADGPSDHVEDYLCDPEEKGAVYRVWASSSKELKDSGEESRGGVTRRRKGGGRGEEEEKLGLCSRGFWRERSGCRRSMQQGESVGARAGWGDGMRV